MINKIDKFPDLKGFPEGIYFDLSNDTYHDDPALSHSGMTKVLISWNDYWIQSCHNPDRKLYQPTDAMIFGERSGMYLLEPEKFHQKYNTYQRNTNTGKGIYLSSTEYKRIKDSIDCILEVPIARDHFTGGYPEVSIFWKCEETGIMLRAKIDYLHTFGALDFKRIASLDNWGIGKAVKNQGLDIQKVLYIKAIIAARKMMKRKNPPVFGKVDPEWLKYFAKDTDILFRFLFQRSTPPYIWEFRELEPEVEREGDNAVHQAIKLYKAGITKFGTSKPPCGTGELKTISQFHVPRRDYDYQN